MPHPHVETEKGMNRYIGVRKLRDDLSRHLGRVRRGARFVITDRGHPVAVLLPYRGAGQRSRADRLAALLVGGHVSPAERGFLPRPPLIRGRGPLLSDIIGENRR